MLIDVGEMRLRFAALCEVIGIFAAKSLDAGEAVVATLVSGVYGGFLSLIFLMEIRGECPDTNLTPSANVKFRPPVKREMSRSFLRRQPGGEGFEPGETFRQTQSGIYRDKWAFTPTQRSSRTNADLDAHLPRLALTPPRPLLAPTRKLARNHPDLG